ncbi:MAG: radical SAM protein [Candidatus Woesearchaeota archaeon]
MKNKPMKILFIVRAPIYEPPIGMMHLSSVLKEGGHLTDLIIVNEVDTFSDVCDQVKEYGPDIIAYSLLSGNEGFFLELNNFLKGKLEFKSIFGGPHTTFFQDLIEKEGVDITCAGEGEYALLELANKLSNNEDITRIPNLAVKIDKRIYRNGMRNLIEELDSLPFPDRGLFYQYKRIGNDPIKHFMATRGCPYNCTYCFNHAYNKLYTGKGKMIRHRSVDNVITEIKQVIDKYPTKMIYFQDDTFILDKEWLKNFAQKYKEEINLPYHCHVRANLVDEDVIRGLKMSGCTGVHMAIETANDKIRNEILRRNMSKKQILNAITLLKKYKIKLLCQNILALPTSQLRDDINTLKLNIKCKPTYAWASIFTPYPGLDLTKFCIENNLLEGEIGKNLYDSCVVKVDQKEKRTRLQRWFAITSRYPILLYSGLLYLLVNINSKYLDKISERIYLYFRKKRDRHIYDLDLKWDKPVYKKQAI